MQLFLESEAGENITVHNHEDKSIWNWVDTLWLPKF